MSDELFQSNDKISEYPYSGDDPKNREIKSAVPILTAVDRTAISFKADLISRRAIELPFEL